MTRIISARRTSTRHESGQALVELALVAPVLLVLVLGIADFCRVFYASISVSNAARAGAQYGLRTGYYNQTSGMQQAAVQDAGLPGFNANASNPNPNATATYFCVCGSDPTAVAANPARGAAQCAAARASCSAPSIWVDVTTNYTFNTITQFPGFPNRVVLNGRAQMRAQ
jgi:Flp pilus assembly protein TadG